MNAKPDKQFWMVWNLQRAAPTVIHEDGATAAAEADRLAQLHPGERFYVLKGIRYVEVAKPLNRVELRPDSDSPF